MPFYLSNLENFPTREDINFVDIFIEINFESLSDVEKLIIEKFFYEEKTLKEIAEELNISKEKVKQIKQKAIMKLKNVNRNLTDFLKKTNKDKVNLLLKEKKYLYQKSIG